MEWQPKVAGKKPTEPQVAYNPKSTTIDVVHTVYTYEVYAREYVCNFSGFSKRIPRLEITLRGAGLHITSAHEPAVPS